MSLLEFPNPVAWFESAKDENQKRDLINATMSTLYSAQITLLWETGRRKLWGEGAALQRTATSMYLTLSTLEKKGLITLTVPKDLLAADNLSQFQTERMV